MGMCPCYIHKSRRSANKYQSSLIVALILNTKSKG